MKYGKNMRRWAEVAHDTTPERREKRRQECDEMQLDVIAFNLPEGAITMAGKPAGEITVPEVRLGWPADWWQGLKQAMYRALPFGLSRWLNKRCPVKLETFYRKEVTLKAIALYPHVQIPATKDYPNSVYPESMPHAVYVDSTPGAKIRQGGAILTRDQCNEVMRCLIDRTGTKDMSAELWDVLVRGEGS